MAIFLAGYFAVWTGFALSALAFDGGVQSLIERWRWLDTRTHLIAGTILLLAGVFQFSSLKERCLDACRSPMGFLWRFYGRGFGRAWKLGVRHGVFCLGCCWGLMLTMTAVGMSSLLWMIGLTGVMAIEKSTRWGKRLVPVVGAALIVWGALTLLHSANEGLRTNHVHSPAEHNTLTHGH
jgi:predicted metal-binding membrane protein